MKNSHAVKLSHGIFNAFNVEKAFICRDVPNILEISFQNNNCYSDISLKEGVNRQHQDKLYIFENQQLFRDLSESYKTSNQSLKFSRVAYSLLCK